MPSNEKKPTKNELAHDLYLKGLHASQRQTKESLEEGIRFFETSIERDPDFSLPHSAWANSLLTMGGAYVPFAKVHTKARELVGKALTLNPDSSDAHTAAGNLALQCDLDWKTAENELQKALSLNSGSFTAHHTYGMLLGLNQRFNEARDEFREAIRLNPASDLAWMGLVQTDYNAGDIYTATTLAEEMVERNPTSVQDRLTLAYCYEAEGRMQDVLKELDKLPVLTDLNTRVSRASLAALAGRVDEARSLVRELEERSRTSFVPRSSIAMLWSALGENSKALDLLEGDFRDGDRAFWFCYQNPEFRGLRKEPRFLSLLRNYRLPAVEEHRPVETRGMTGSETRTKVAAK